MFNHFKVALEGNWVLSLICYFRIKKETGPLQGLLGPFLTGQ